MTSQLVILKKTSQLVIFRVTEKGLIGQYISKGYLRTANKNIKKIAPESIYEYSYSTPIF